MMGALLLVTGTKVEDNRLRGAVIQLSNVFWWCNLVRLYSLYKIIYPKRRIGSYFIMGTIVSPKTKITQLDPFDISLLSSTASPQKFSAAMGLGSNVWGQGLGFRG